MKKTILTIALLPVFAGAQTTYQRAQMNQDSTSIIPNPTMFAVTPAINTSSSSNTGAPLVNGACGTDNGKTLTALPTNMCRTGTPSAITTTSTRYSWSCSGNYISSSTASCSATRSVVPALRALGAHCFISYDPWGRPAGANLGMSYIVWQDIATGTTSVDYGSAHMASFGIVNKNVCGYFYSGAPGATDGWLTTFLSLPRI